MAQVFMTKEFVLGIGLLVATSLCAQSKRVAIFVNNGVDTANVEIAAAIGLWENYLNSRPDSIYDNPYWSQKEKQRYKDCDLLRSAFSPNLYALALRYKPTVISVAEIDGGWKVRTLFAAPTDEGFAAPLCISNVAVKKENGEYKLYNVLPLNAQSWQRRKIGSIIFVSPPEHRFNAKLAQRLNRFVDSLATLFKIPVVPVEYYYADDLAKVQRLRGLDYEMGEGNKRQTSGRGDWQNRIVYSGSNSEWYPHELAHIYLTPHFPNAHYYFSEGYATLLGGHRDKPLAFHIKRTHEYLQKHPELNLNDLFAFDYMDNITNPANVFGGLLCQMAQEKGGLDLIEKLMSYGGEEEDFYKAVKEVFGVKPGNLNEFLRRKIAEYAVR